MNRITRRKTPKLGSSKKKSNPFESRGMEKFQEVYSELERMRASIAAQEGVSTSDVWFTRGTSKGRDWIPLVVGKNRSSSVTRQHSIPHWETDDDEKLSSPQVSSEREVSQESRNSSSSCSWCPFRSETLLFDLQQSARKALKAVTLFIMLVAAVADILIAVVAGCLSSLVASYLRPLWAPHLPPKCQERTKELGFNFSSKTLATYSCMSAPSSPRWQLQQQHERQQEGSLNASRGSSKQTTSFSTPVSPVRNSSTFFSPGRTVELSKLSPSRQMVHEKEEEEVKQVEQLRSDPIPVVFAVMVILLGLSCGRVTAVSLASVTWFVFPFARRLFGSWGE